MNIASRPRDTTTRVATFISKRFMSGKTYHRRFGFSLCPEGLCL